MFVFFVFEKNKIIWKLPPKIFFEIASFLFICLLKNYLNCGNFSPWQFGLAGYKVSPPMLNVVIAFNSYFSVQFIKRLYHGPPHLKSLNASSIQTPPSCHRTEFVDPNHSFISPRSNNVKALKFWDGFYGKSGPERAIKTVNVSAVWIFVTLLCKSGWNGNVNLRLTCHTKLCSNCR